MVPVIFVFIHVIFEVVGILADVDILVFPVFFLYSFVFNSIFYLIVFSFVVVVVIVVFDSLFLIFPCK